MSTTTIPSPLAIAKIANAKRRTIPAPPTPAILAVVEPSDPGKRVTLGVRDEVVTLGVHDGVVRTKHLQRGQRVRPWVHGEARGGERIVDSVTKVEDGAVWHVTFATAHPAQDYKAAYRWFDESLVGTDIKAVRKVPAFVPAHI